MNDPKLTVHELNAFFSTQIMPKEIVLRAGEYIQDTAKFVSTHLAIIGQSDPKGLNDAFYQRLILLREELKQLL